MRASVVRSTSTTSSARSSTESGRVSRTRTPVISYTVSFRLSKCWTLTVEITSMPRARMSSTLCQRFSCADPGTLVCASSSTATTAGRRAMTAAVSISSKTLPRYSMRLRGMTRQALRQLRDRDAPVGLDEADDEVLAALEPSLRLGRAS